MIRLITTLCLLLFISGEAVSNPASLSRQHVVEIRAFSFQPSNTVVSPGDTIVWVNRDIVPHTVTADGGAWTSHPLEEGQSWDVVVEENQIYSYYCVFHPHMKGVLSPS